MKIMKKVVLIAVMAAQAPLLNAATRGCPCHKPPAQPTQPAQPAQAVQTDQPIQPLQVPAEAPARQCNESMPSVEECCMMIKDEVQKVTDSCAADTIKDVVMMVENHEMMKSTAQQSGDPEQSEDVHPPIHHQKMSKSCDEPMQPQEMSLHEMRDGSDNMMTPMDIDKTPKEMLSDCCVALAEQAVQNCDMPAFDRAEAIMEKVEMLPEMK